MDDLISRQSAIDKVKKTCITCKHYPPESKWPCIDCDMRNPADRWEPQEAKNSNQEVKNSSDLISRQAAIDAVSEACFELRGVFGRCEDAIKNLPSAQQWIPCSESLPAVGVNVLVCYELGQIRYVSIGEFLGDGEFHGCDDEYLTEEGRKRKAFAWMPLPKPYERKEK